MVTMVIMICHIPYSWIFGWSFFSFYDTSNFCFCCVDHIIQLAIYNLGHLIIVIALNKNIKSFEIQLYDSKFAYLTVRTNKHFPYCTLLQPTHTCFKPLVNRGHGFISVGV